MSFRPEQVGKELRKALSQALQEELPIEKYGLITVTDVVVSQGMENAKIFISSLLHGRQLVEDLNRKQFHWKNAIKNLVSLRKIPTLVFEWDISNERVDRMEQLMEDQKKE